MSTFQYDVKQAHINESGFLVRGRTRVKSVSFTGTATAGTVSMFDTLTAPVTTATYGRSGTTVTVTSTAHGLSTGATIGAAFGTGTGGTGTDGNYVITRVDANTFTLTDINTGSITAGAAMVYSGRWLMTFDVSASDTFNNVSLIPGDGVVAYSGVYAYMTNLTATNIFYG